MNVGQYTSSSNGGLDELIELVVGTNGKQQVAGVDTLHVHILRGVTGKLQQFGSQVLEDGSAVDGGGGSNTTSGVRAFLQETVDTTDRELFQSTEGERDSERERFGEKERKRHRVKSAQTGSEIPQEQDYRRKGQLTEDIEESFGYRGAMQMGRRQEGARLRPTRRAGAPKTSADLQTHRRLFRTWRPALWERDWGFLLLATEAVLFLAGFFPACSDLRRKRGV